MALIVPPGTERYIRQHRSTIEPEDYGEVCRDEVRALGLAGVSGGTGWLVPGDVLDIGCGLGGPSVFLQRLCGGTLYALDGTGWSPWRVGFRRSMRPYNDLALTAQLLEMNGVDDYVLIDVDQAGHQPLPAVDNVVSFLSWCWHYPAAAYLERVRTCLRPGGRIVVDIRDDPHLTTEDAFAAAGFRQLGCFPIPKGHRTCWTRP